MEKIQNRKKVKRSLILQKALELFATKGYHSATTAEIAKAANIAKGTLFNYFESKEHLLRSLVFETLLELAEMIDPNHDGIVTQEEFFSVIHKSRKWIVDHPQFLSLYFSMVSQPPVFNLFKAEIFEKLAPYMEKLAAFFQKAGFKDSYAEVRFFLAMLDGIAIHYAMDSKNFPIDKIEEKIIGYYEGKMSRNISS
ncbi:TetR/AcrR family transcriptional regulator [Marinilabilia salmonicolor]|uniref:TetR family transcriptional regulator n=1 Tax=Marinilabilia salmonicolor TaxID=989 RepID=A0A368UM45_9BACT|nr:TetR/AcrR family transcriptional regulator [Marinilabilia salmonicolor]RCW29819.1 TetR family transcriptional regulator [Marinilabilia salmonicolor]